MCVSPNAIKLNGMMLLSKPVIANAPHIRGDHGNLRPVANTTGSSTAAPAITRPNAMVNGGSPALSSTL